MTEKHNDKEEKYQDKGRKDRNDTYDRDSKYKCRKRRIGKRQ